MPRRSGRAIFPFVSRLNWPPRLAQIAPPRPPPEGFPMLDTPVSPCPGAAGAPAGMGREAALPGGDLPGRGSAGGIGRRRRASSAISRRSASRSSAPRRSTTSAGRSPAPSPQEGVFPVIYQAPFGAYVQEVLNPASALHGFAPELAVIAPEARDLVEALPPGASAADVARRDRSQGGAVRPRLGRARGARLPRRAASAGPARRTVPRRGGAPRPRLAVQPGARP